MNMKSIAVSAVYYQMLVELSKKAKKSPENYMGDLINDTYGKK